MTAEMSLPPEVTFHRFFTHVLNPVERKQYRGRADLARIPMSTSEASMLAAIRDSLNDALHNEPTNVPNHLAHDPFHCDYVDSDIPNAIAFRYDGYSFIGITLPFIRHLWDVCGRLSKSAAIIGASHSVDAAGATGGSGSIFSRPTEANGYSPSVC